MEEIMFALTFIIILMLFLVGGDFTSGSLSTGVVTGIITASLAYLGAHYHRYGKWT